MSFEIRSLFWKMKVERSKIILMEKKDLTFKKIYRRQISKYFVSRSFIDFIFASKTNRIQKIISRNPLFVVTIFCIPMKSLNRSFVRKKAKKIHDSMDSLKWFFLKVWIQVENKISIEFKSWKQISLSKHFSDSSWQIVKNNFFQIAKYDLWIVSITIWLETMFLSWSKIYQMCRRNEYWIEAKYISQILFVRHWFYRTPEDGRKKEETHK